jgi:hypothetical protein
MPAQPRCAACGAEVPPAASFCPRCGRATAPIVRDLERLDVEPPPRGERQRTVARTDGGGPRRRGIAALAALAILLGGTVLLLSDGRSDDGREADAADGEAAGAVTTTSVGSGKARLIYPEPTKPGDTTSTRPPTTSRPPTTTSTTTTLVEYLGEGNGVFGAPTLSLRPVLGEPTGGLSLYVVGDGLIRRVELDSGRVTILATSDRGGRDVYAIELLADRLVLGGSTTYEVARDLSGGFLQSSRQVSVGMRVPGTDQHWSLEVLDGRARVVLSGESGVIARYDVPPGVNPIGVVSDRLVFFGGGRIYTLDPRGAMQAYGVGTVVSASGGWMLWWSCDASVRCAYHLGDATDPDVKAVRVPESFTSSMYGMYGMYGTGHVSAVSPDGDHLLLPGESGLQLIRASTGEVVTDRDLTWSTTWSSDSRWLFHYTASGSVEAIDTTDGHAVELLPSTGSNVQNGSRMLAVG